MKNARLLVGVAALASSVFADDPRPETFHAYADSDICARLMLGLITPTRVGCSQSTVKDGANGYFPAAVDGFFALYRVIRSCVMSSVLPQYTTPPALVSRIRS